MDGLKEIKGFPGYFLNRNGECFSTKRKNLGLVKMHGGTHKCGYPMVMLVDRNKKPHYLTLHRLLLSTFVRPPKHGECCRHLNGDTSDLRLENLAWGTMKDNAADTKRHGKMYRGDKHPMHKLTESEVRKIREASKNGVYGKTLAKMYGVSIANISFILNRKLWKHI